VVCVVLSVSCGGNDDDQVSSTSVAATSTTAAESAFGDYIGLSVDEAGARADADQRTWRVVEEDGVPRPVTMDFIETRLNFTVEDGTVVRVTTG
jgi:hypothetical protein